MPKTPEFLRFLFSLKKFEELRGTSRDFEGLRESSRKFEELRGTSRGRSGEFWKGFFSVWTILCPNWPDCSNFARKPRAKGR